MGWLYYSSQDDTNVELQKINDELFLCFISLTMLCNEAKVPKANPIIPSKMIMMSFNIQKNLEKIMFSFVCELFQFQNVNKWIKGGNIIDKALLATDPTKLIRSPKSGIVKAREAIVIGYKCEVITKLQTYLLEEQVEFWSTAEVLFLWLLDMTYTVVVTCLLVDLSTSILMAQ